MGAFAHPALAAPMPTLHHELCCFSQHLRIETSQKTQRTAAATEFLCSFQFHWLSWLNLPPPSFLHHVQDQSFPTPQTQALSAEELRWDGAIPQLCLALTCWRTACNGGAGHGSWALRTFHLSKGAGFKLLIWRAAWGLLLCTSSTGFMEIWRTVAANLLCSLVPQGLEAHLAIRRTKLQMGGISPFSSLSLEILTVLSSPVLTLTHFWP